MFFKPNSFKDYLLHLLVIVILSGGGLVYFFFRYLPEQTRHGEELTVPALQGKELATAVEIISALDLRYTINDSAYVEGEKPGKIISQHPKNGSKVKANRKIYLTITSRNPTNVEIPEDLTNKTLKNVRLILSQLGLYIGNTTIVEDQFNLVLKATWQGKELTKGVSLPKYSKIDLTIGSGTKTTDDDIEDIDLLNGDNQ